MEKELKFSIFITSHNSPNECKSFDSLRTAGYTGNIHIVIDDNDPQFDAYKKVANVLVFNKQEYVDKLDIGMSKENPQLAAVLYARAAVEDFAKDMGLDYFIVMDDDLLGFRYRYVKDNKLCSKPVENFDEVIYNYIEFIKASNSLCLSFAHDGSFIGGAECVLSGKMLERRSCHTLYLRDASKEFNWRFAVNEDYVTSLLYANVGELMFTLPFVQRTISGMNDRKEGMHDLYESTSEFQRAFYNVIACPWTCSVAEYKGHKVVRTNKNIAYPKIISDKYRR